MEALKTNQLNWIQEGDISFLKRPEVQVITDYLNSYVDEICPLEYEIETSIDPRLFCELLQEDLPGDRSDLNKIKFIEEIISLSGIFLNLCETKEVKVSLEVVDHNMCRLFHVDNIKQRMLCTYRGLGTEWLDESNTMREGLGQGDNFKVAKNFKSVHRAEPFEILLLRGKKMPNSLGGAVHRSPEISHLHQKRVLLKIDEC